MSPQKQEKLIVLAIILAALAVFLLIAWIRERMKNRVPIMEIEAEVLSKRLVAQTHSSTFGLVNGLYYYVTFHMADGTVAELRTPEGSGRYEEGTKGILIYQGNKCEKFTPYE